MSGNSGEFLGLGRRSERVFLKLRGELDSGVYPPNEKLPNEMQLCERWGVSRNTVRRAIAKLAAEGRVERRQGSGTYVREQPKEGPALSQTLAVMFPFLDNTLHPAHQMALDLGYLMCPFAHVDWSPKTERAFLERVLFERHRALLALCTPVAPRNDALLEELALAGVRVIHVEHYRRELPDQGYLLPDYERGGEMAAAAMMIAGCESLHFLSLEDDGPYAEIALQGFRNAHIDHRGTELPPDQHLQLATRNAGTPHNQGFEELIDRLPPRSGVLARSPNLADEFLDHLRKRGRNSPEDVYVMCINHLLNHRETAVVDMIDFDWKGSLQRAIQLAAAPAWKEIRELIRPRLVRAGHCLFGDGLEGRE